MNALSKISISDLTVEERLELIEALWDSLDDVDLTPAQKIELDRLIEKIGADRRDPVTWHAVRARVLAPQGF